MQLVGFWCTVLHLDITIDHFQYNNMSEAQCNNLEYQHIKENTKENIVFCLKPEHAFMSSFKVLFF